MANAAAKNQEEKENGDGEIDDISTPSTPQPASMDDFASGKTVHSSYLDQMQVLGVRGLRQLLRDRFTLAIRLFMTLFFAFFLAALYSEVDDGQKGTLCLNMHIFCLYISQMTNFVSRCSKKLTKC